MKTIKSQMNRLSTKTSIWKMFYATILAIFLLSMAPAASAQGGLSVSPSNATTQPGSAAIYTITDNCKCSVIFGATISPNVSNGPTLTLSRYHLVNGGSVFLRVDAGSSTPLMTYTITAMARDTQSGHTKSGAATLIVNDFTIAANPTSITVLAGQAATSTVTATGFNGFSGNIHYSTPITPWPGLTCSLQPAVATLSATVTTVNSTLSCSGTSGTYTIDISASPDNGLPVRSATVTITVN